jgi:hypothetical protein
MEGDRGEYVRSLPECTGCIPKLGIADLPRFTRWNRYQPKTKASRKGRGGRSGKENEIFLASSFCSSD